MVIGRFTTKDARLPIIKILHTPFRFCIGFWRVIKIRFMSVGGLMKAMVIGIIYRKA